MQLQIQIFREDNETQHMTTSSFLMAYKSMLYLPMTLFANDVRIKVASPRSPIFTEPVGPVMKMLSHFKSRWIIGGVLVCRNCSPFKICRHQLLKTFGFMTLKRFKYLQREQHNWRVSNGSIHQVSLALLSWGIKRQNSDPIASKYISTVYYNHI